MGVKEEVYAGSEKQNRRGGVAVSPCRIVGKEKAKLFLTWRIKSEILREIFEVGYVSGFLRSIPRSNSYAVSLS
jgi:hypothetical protein